MRRGLKSRKGPIVNPNRTVSVDYTPYQRAPQINDVLRNAYNQVYIMVDSANDYVTTSNTVPTLFGKYITLAQFSRASTLSSYFAQYRIRQVEIWLEFGFGLGTESSADTGVFASGVCLNSAATPASLNAVEALPGALVTGMFRSHYHRLMPRPASVAYDGALSSGYYQTPTGSWISCSDTAVQHYGLKVYLDTLSVNGLPLRYRTRVVVDFRGTPA